jgi:WD40 repeat protein
MNNSGTKLVTGGDDSVLRLYSNLEQKGSKFDAGKPKEIRLHTAAINNIEFSRDEKIMASSSDDLTCRLISTDTGEQLRKLEFGDNITRYKFLSCQYTYDLQFRHLP